MTSRLPPLLELYLRLPPETSLILLTNVLGASTNWLVQRYLCSFLASSSTSSQRDGSATKEAGETGEDDEVSVILVSFLRDHAFWKEGAGRLGIDLDGLSRRGRFVFVDGLSGLFTPPGGLKSKPSAGGGGAGTRVLSGATVQELRKELNEAVTGLRVTRPDSKIMLVLDGPDLLLAASGKTISGLVLQEILLDIREKVHSSIVTLSADEPLISAQTTMLEKEHAAFTLSLAHEAEMVISLRMLDTGTARDVSGVLRVTHGGNATGTLVEERELLYFVGGDGGVRVFERGQ
ncbi:uncharacterized protein BCR38DRAFT_338279 [Pseudomassariella vexata]|uniref:Elongator complex protein 6 n=1 Tax=Pseudomassariella vexata TaxID=1141098 RepID=A0A1Y2EA38_9PEZI|nr:uncharacterized protein BCR38DRAFT_338279 [Pseudomassariella vexata]ORY67725.1 hypothetical protein BCR38DRAFT_338279 [Pseudomassariella vexata]